MDQAPRQSWTLAFVDRELEAAYREAYWDELRLVARWGYAVTFVLLALFGVAEWWLFPDRFVDFAILRYGLMLPVLGLFGPLFLAPQLDWVMQRWFQEVQAVCTTVVFSVFAAMGLLAFDLTSQAHMLYGGVMFGLCALFPYLVQRMRVVYAAAIGWVAFACAMLLILGVASPDPFTLGVLTVGGVFCNFVGMSGASFIESYSRRHFLALRALNEERAKTEALLLNVLPQPIADRLRASEKPIADSFDAVTVLFADIVGFTPLSATMAPQELVALLNRVFTAFDHIADAAGVEKIKTIGDAYMAAAGIPEPMGDHADAMAGVALEMRTWLADNEAELGQLQIRIGMHSGPVVAGVIGRRKFIYDLWGDTVNTAARMESHGLEAGIQITAATRELLVADYVLEERGTIEVKGKGPMQTWWLLERREG